MSDYDYDEGYRAGMQKMREVGQRRVEELEAKQAKAEEAIGKRMPSLPLNQEQLENFILHHVHLWAQEFVKATGGDLSEVMDAEFEDFYVRLADKLRKEVLPKFEDAA